MGVPSALHSVSPKLADPLALYLAHLPGYQADVVLEEDIAGVCDGSLSSSIWWMFLKEGPS